MKDEVFVVAFGKKVKELRKKQGMSQYRLADESDMSRSQIVRIENGEVNTSIASARTLAEVLRVDICDLFD